MTGRADQLASDQFTALLAEAKPLLWGTRPGDAVMIDPSATVRVFRANSLTAAELRSIALAASTLANAAYDAAIGDLADTLTTERRMRW